MASLPRFIKKLVVVGGEYETQDGRPVRVICTDRSSPNHVVGLIRLPSGGEELHVFDGTGKSSLRQELSIVEVIRRTYYRSVCIGGIGHNNHDTRDEVVAMHNTIGCIKVELVNDKVKNVTVEMFASKG